MDDPDEGVDCLSVVGFIDVQGGVDGTELMEEVSDGLEGGIGCLGVSFPSPVLLMSLGRENGCEGSNDLGDTAFGLSGIIPAFLKLAIPYSFLYPFFQASAKKQGKSRLVATRCCLLVKSCTTLYQADLSGFKTATSSGWSMCVQ